MTKRRWPKRLVWTSILVGLGIVAVVVVPGNAATIPAPSRAGASQSPSIAQQLPAASATPTTPSASASEPTVPDTLTPSPSPTPESTPSPSPTPVTPLKPAPKVAPAPPTVDCAAKAIKCVALTFDDGPGPYTDKLLAELAKAKVPATFFMIGRNVAEHPTTAKHVAESGNQICGHSWKHDTLTHLSPAKIRKDFAKTSAEIYKATGVSIHCFRPPGGAWNKKVLKNTDAAAIIWSVDTVDWRDRVVKTIVKRAAKAEAGQIILMHDIHPKSVAAVPKVIEKLKAKGFTLVTIDDLAGGAAKLHQGVVLSRTNG